MMKPYMVLKTVELTGMIKHLNLLWNILILLLFHTMGLSNN